MKIAILSGKGGTGKTLVSVNLAAVAKESVYIDCDVEEPNDIKRSKVRVKIPFIDYTKCIKRLFEESNSNEDITFIAQIIVELLKKSQIVIIKVD